MVLCSRLWIGMQYVNLTIIECLDSIYIWVFWKLIFYLCLFGYNVGWLCFFPYRGYQLSLYLKVALSFVQCLHLTYCFAVSFQLSKRLFVFCFWLAFVFIFSETNLVFLLCYQQSWVKIKLNSRLQKISKL